MAEFVQAFETLSTLCTQTTAPHNINAVRNSYNFQSPLNHIAILQSSVNLPRNTVSKEDGMLQVS